jgi:hypothetical protein
MKLKLNLLIPILENVSSSNRYSKAYLNLKNVISLENRADYKFKDQEVYTKFQNLEKKFNNFLCDIPLIVVEKYFNDNKEDHNKFIYLEYKDEELTDLKIMELYNELETYFQECFTLACLIADLYNFEVKFNETNNDYETKELI